MDYISVQGACEGNLNHVTIDIPRNKFTVFTGVSGSGKSTLLMDVLYMESQRQYLEAMSFQGIAKPKVERIQNASPAIIISQTDANQNPRSTVGTLTDIYTGLRMIYEKLGVRTCPECGKVISAADCREETEKSGEDFRVYMYCCECNHRMRKLTRTDFSFNTREGACPACEGLGQKLEVNREAVVNEGLSLEEGAVDFWENKYRDYQMEALAAAYDYYGIPVPKGKKIAQYDELQKAVLYEGVSSELIKVRFPEREAPKTVANGRFEGIIPTLKRRLANQNGESKTILKYFTMAECPECQGERLGEKSRGVTVCGVRLPQIAGLSMRELADWIRNLSVSLKDNNQTLVKDYLLDIETKVHRFLNVGLGYLTLDRQIITLSGGELQRIRLAAVLDSDLTGIIYILDEPTVGLHPKDTGGLITILKRLRDLGNTVLVIEHDPDVMKAADHIVDMGPGSGRFGGNIIGAGTLDEIRKQPLSVTGQYLNQPHPGKSTFREGNGSFVKIRNACKFNLKHLDVDIPLGCLVTITGPSGSGKSTLICEILALGNSGGKENRVEGCENVDEIIQVGQTPINRSKRSNIATYTEIYTEIRAIFAKLEEAKEQGLTARDFSFNTPGGRCENCEGMGVVSNNLLFFENNEVVCPVCRGKRFQDYVLSVKLNGLSITDILKLSVEEAAPVFEKHPKILRTLNLLKDVGLGYLEIGQILTTLSGGEGQRLKLAKELIGNTAGRGLYLLDEPTRGLHPLDIENFLKLLNRLADTGNSVIVIEHNQQIIQNSDWIIDLGPDGGEQGGRLIYTGPPAGLPAFKKG
ncbi:ATP-binding cassette domain-containing protein [Diplocloster agilis]|uniref:UvrABC system protein A n=1 Tax=Diplocloster agilis TaxID=2850323 RepID=A0A949NI09_9FIRM|nr:excinuclease ABC subunit UvrA [Diplocloster agilis]MBU9739173.1 excinuclease ABC subunit UvrA [Diplocloster agilis]